MQVFSQVWASGLSVGFAFRYQMMELFLVPCFTKLFPFLEKAQDNVSFGKLLVKSDCLPAIGIECDGPVLWNMLVALFLTDCP